VQEGVLRLSPRGSRPRTARNRAFHKHGFAKPRHQRSRDRAERARESGRMLPALPAGLELSTSKPRRACREGRGFRSSSSSSTCDRASRRSARAARSRLRNTRAVLPTDRERQALGHTPRRELPHAVREFAALKISCCIRSCVALGGSCRSLPVIRCGSCSESWRNHEAPMPQVLEHHIAGRELVEALGGGAAVCCSRPAKRCTARANRTFERFVCGAFEAPTGGQAR